MSGTALADTIGETSFLAAPMFARRRQRIDRILALLEVNRSLHIRDAAQLLGVSEMTLRRDVAQCPREVLYLGGHLVTPEARPASPYSLDNERDVRLQYKQAIGRLAAARIENGDSVFIDCGTTTPHIVGALPKEIECTLLCYSANVAFPASAFPKVTLVLLGGVFYPASATYYCDESLVFLKKFGINKAFFSAGGVSLARGLSCSHLHEVKVKQAVMEVAVEKILVADSGKFERVRPAFFGPCTAVDAVITDTGIAHDVAEKLRGLGVDLKIVAT